MFTLHMDSRLLYSLLNTPASVCRQTFTVLHRVLVKYFGKASHASAYPWEGVNALDAAVLAYNNVSVLRQQLKPEWRLHGEEQTVKVNC